MIEFHFFGMPIKTLGSLGKIRVGWETRHTHIFFGLREIKLAGLPANQRTSYHEPSCTKPNTLFDK